MSDSNERSLQEEEFLLRRNGRELPVFAVGPNDVASAGLILIHEIFGLNEHIRDVSRRFAKTLGLRVFAPDLFADRPGLPADKNDLDGMRAVWSKIPDSELIGDLQALYQEMSKRDDVLSETVGTIGYCMGGAMALMFACSTPHIAFLIDYYGRVRYPEITETKTKHPIDYACGNVCPTLGLFSGIDSLIPVSDVEQLEDRLKQYSPDVQLKIYPDAPHAFFNDTRDHYNEAAAKDAWERTVEFINRQISVKNG
ncbi:dienelactone hydrolase family protein [Candidatus Obscuribacterales bacterium]|nr:dienelactone hydrolase family protein [Candidatus Obscuribacterales bacterium]MBX3136306.1 dienelactone hydrolase family protein [Candidatus Obscuribacterales bacterium]MBX3148763.1 dienelactone hydrolase family protein [Candidatus Obscuribacterales bacterium]